MIVLNFQHVLRLNQFNALMDSVFQVNKTAAIVILHRTLHLKLALVKVYYYAFPTWFLVSPN